MISKNRLILVKEQEFDYDVKVTSNVDTIEFLEKNKAKMNEKNVWDSTWTERENMTENQKQRMREILKDGIGFVE